MNRPSIAVLWALGLALLGVLAWLVAQGQGWMLDRDFFTFWAGGRGLLEGQNLYETQAWQSIHSRYGSTWFPNPVFIYAPPTAVLLIPVAALPAPAASVLWLWLSLLGILLPSGFLVREITGTWARGALWGVAGLLLFLPVTLTLLMGQISAVVLALVAAAALLGRRGHWFSAGLVLGLTVVKPQPVLLLLAAAGLWFVLRRQWSGLAGLALSLGAQGLASLALFPSFLPDYQAAVLSKVGGVAGRMPTLWGIGHDLWGSDLFGAVALVALTVLLTVYLVNRWRQADVLDVIGLLIILSLITTPYLWDYDLVLLLVPLTVALARLGQRGVPGWYLALVIVGVDVLALVLLAIASVRASSTLGILLPITVGALFLFSRTPIAPGTATRD